MGSTKQPLLDPTTRADVALKQILLGLLDRIEANEAGTRKGLDAEFLHDFRVAVRRTRSALTQIRNVLPPQTTQRFRRAFAWLQRETGPTRDLDVYLLKMPHYQKMLPPRTKGDLAPLTTLLQERQRESQLQLVQMLDSARYRNLTGRWRTFLEKPTPRRPTASRALRPIGELASARIWKVYRRICKEGQAIVSETPDAALHALRLRCKKLRYLMEFFRSMYDPKAVGGLIKALKLLQDNLGDFNDYTVQQLAMQGFAAALEDQGASQRTSRAIGQLLDQLHRGQLAERQAFEKRFARFASARNQSTFRTLFA